MFRERRGHLDRAGNQSSDAARLGLVADDADDALGLSVSDEGSSEAKVFAVGENSLQRQNVRLLRHGERFAGERGFVHLEVADVEQPKVGGHAVAGLQQHDIAGNERL